VQRAGRPANCQASGLAGLRAFQTMVCQARCKQD
jgi:hypothetical protein